MTALFENTGTVDVQVGAVSLDVGRGAGFVTTGDFMGAAGTTLSVGDGDLSASVHLHGDHVGLSNVAMLGVYDATGSTNLSGDVTFTGTILHVGDMTLV